MSKPWNSRTLTRRQLVRALVLGGAVAAAGPYAPPLLATGDIDAGTRMVAAIFFESHKAAALQRALRYAGDNGFVASMPALLHARINVSYDNIIWNTWFTANSEECVVTTPRGSPVVVAVHGGGIFATPGRFERSLRADLNRHNPEGLTGQYAAKITETEARDVLEGKLPDGSEIPVYPFDEFKRGVADLPRRYGVVVDFEMAKNATSGYQPFDELKDNPMMLVRAGGAGAAMAYLDKAQARHDTKRMGNWHPLNRIDPDQPQARILSLAGNRGGLGSEGDDLGQGWGYDAEFGLSHTGFIGLARYVAIAPHDVSASLQYLDFKP